MWYRCNILSGLRRSSILLCRQRHSVANRVHMLSVNFGNQNSVDNFLKRLSDDERQTLADSLVAVKEKIKKPHPASIESLAFKALCIVAFSNGLPFIGFGFLDNSLMIVAGESIENTWGAMLGISTMASAALGNWISDVVGMGTAGYVDALCYKIGIRAPEMTEEQMNLFSTRFFVVLGRSIGITIGCFLGMIPLLFYNHGEKGEEKDATAVK